MKSVVVIDSVSRAAGGLFDAERRLHQELAAIGVETVVFSLEDEFVAVDAAAWSPLRPHVFPVRSPVSLGWSPRHHEALLAESGDVLYRAGLWRLPSRSAHCWSRAFNRPEIIAPHGMLDTWAVQNSGWKKRLVRWVFEDAHLRDASCIRALCESEAQAIRLFGLRNPIAIIPNGIDVPRIENQKSIIRNAPWTKSVESGRKVFLYLGRIHPKKGLVNLLKAWRSAIRSQPSTNDSWCLAIAGWNQGSHEAELKELATELGLAWVDLRDQPSAVNHQPSLVFLGPQFDDAKAACYAHCDAFILPSFSEGLPMAVLEAWAYSKPVLMTPECNLPEGFASSAAIRIEANPESIADALKNMLRVPDSTLSSIGDNGRLLVAQKFTWPKIAAEMKSVYEWVLGAGSKPGSMQTL